MTTLLQTEAEQTSRSALVVRAAEFGHGKRAVIRIDKMVLRQAERIGLVGPSGCGKTTFLAAVAGMSEPFRGDVEINGHARDAVWRAQNTARTLQSFPLFHWLTVRENLALACRIRRVTDQRIDEILEQLSADHLAGKYPKQLSGGERCRASLAQAVIAKPKLLLLDEPFTGLDSLVKEDVASSIFAYAHAREIAVLLVTHDLYDAVNFTERVFVVGKQPVSEIVAEVETNAPDAGKRIRESLRANS